MADSTTPTLISATDLVVQYGINTILNKATFSIHEQDRIGLLGRNGCGKSTFLKLLAGLQKPDAGSIVRRRDLVVGYLPQDFTLDLQKNVYQNIRDGAAHVDELLQRYENLSAHATNASELEGRIAALDGWNVDYRVKEVMSHLNTPAGERDVNTLSGGEKRRVAIARAILSRPDLLILDEPTNHLDPEAIEWVVQFLTSYRGAFLVVTHDRYFLDAITTSILELSNGIFFPYEGNYTDYLLSKAERQSADEKNEQSRQGFLRRELEWVRRGPKARTTKSKSRLDRYFEVAGQAGLKEEKEMDMVIPPAPQMGNRVVELTQVGIELGGRYLFRNLDLNFEPGTRVGVAGRNGLGKSTLLKIVLGELPPTEGSVKIGDLTRFNYVDQNRLTLDPMKTVYDEASQGSEVIQFGAEKISVRAYLRRFLFAEERINTQVRYLSGGEKSRLLLARILKNGGNFLILDEPTNDLDLPSLRVLEEALLSFQGSLLVVSHDRYFLNRVCNGIVAFEGDGRVVYSAGDYDYYLEKRKRSQVLASAAQSVAKASKETAKTGPARKLKWKEAQELAGMEAIVHAAEAEVARLEGVLQDPGIYKDRVRHTETSIQLDKARAKVTRLYERWQELDSLSQA